jgi:glycosyltransferase involved in cell wall biosynthesis
MCLNDAKKYRFDVCIPTWNSSEVLGVTLDKLADSVNSSEAVINRLILIDNISEDETVSVARSKASEYGWEIIIRRKESSLPEAREQAVQNVQTSWFLFLDDDVRISECYISQIFGCVAPIIGAVQGRKRSSTGSPWEWMQRRVYRGGTHATLVRTDALRGLSIPEGVKVLEDEYIRRYIESSGYIWVFNHQAIFAHDSMKRHPVGWEQGFIAGKYDLMPFHSVLLMIGSAVLSFKNPLNRLVLMVGYIFGLFFGKN